MISFKIKKQNIFKVSQFTKRFVFLTNFVFNVLTFSGMCGLVERKRQNDVLHGNVNMDASHNSKLDVLNHTNYKMLMKFQWITEYFQPNLSDKNFAMSQISITVLNKTLSNSESEDLGTTLWDKFVVKKYNWQHIRRRFQKFNAVQKYYKIIKKHA